jgi:hypothetical protein
MASGWLTPWAIFWTTLNKYIIKQEDGLGPSWEFPNAQGVVSLLSGEGVILSPAQAVTVAVGGTVTPTLTVDPVKVLTISGAGGLADDLDSFVVPAAWVGKLILCKMAGAGTITIKHSASIVMPTDFVLDNAADRFLCEVTAVNTVVCLIRQGNA